MLVAVDLTDLYLPERDPGQGRAYPGPVPVGQCPALADLAERLLDLAEDQAEDAFSVSVCIGGSEPPMLFRGQRQRTVQGVTLIFRRLHREVPALEGLLPRGVVEVLTDRSLCSGGLVVICGGPGQGKSTTVAASVAARLRGHGGVCVTCEDPPEIPLEGAHGAGYCLQTEVSKAQPLEQALHAALRSFPVGAPSMLLVGEVRSKSAASEVLHAALNGTLVLLTLHATSPIDALHRLTGLTGGDDYALSSLAASIRVILHQRIDRGVMRVRPLVVPAEGGEAIRSPIRQGKFELLATVLQQQAQLLQQGRPIAV